MSGEILTLSLGGYANYVSSHYWNIQDEMLGFQEKEGWEDIASTINPNVLFSISESRTVRIGSSEVFHAPYVHCEYQW